MVTSARKSAKTPRRRGAKARTATPRAAKARRTDIPARSTPLRAEGRTPTAHDELVATLADLNATSEKLMAIDPASLSDEGVAGRTTRASPASRAALADVAATNWWCGGRPALGARGRYRRRRTPCGAAWYQPAA